MTNREEDMGESDADVTWSVQEALPGNVDCSFNDSNRPKDPVCYRYMEGSTKHANKKRHKSSQQGAGVSKVPGYGLGLSRGFSLWRTLKDIRHCITKVSDPMTKAQRRSLRRKLSYYVDDLERIVVGVNPRAPVTSSEDTNSGDEEMREEVNALIEDALDEAALQGKIVQSDYFETRMSYLEQKCVTLKNQLEEVASNTFTQEDAASKAAQEKDKPKKRKIEEEDADGDGEKKKLLRKRRDSSCSPALHSQPAVINKYLCGTRLESDSGDLGGEYRNSISPVVEEHTSNKSSDEGECSTVFGIVKSHLKEGAQKDESQRNLEEVTRRPGNKPFRGWGTAGRSRGRGKTRGSGWMNRIIVKH